MSKNKLYSFLRGLVYLPAKLIFPVKVIGLENTPVPEKIITVSNHLSWTDIVIIAVNVKGYRHMVAKKELAANKFLVSLFDKLGIITIDRENTDMGAIKKVLSALKKGEGITIFPEGTRNKDGGDMQQVKAGTAMFAIKGGSEIVPVMIHHRQRVFSRNYMYIGEPFSVAEYGIGRVDANAIELAAAKIERKMRDAQEYLNDYVAKKRWREDKLIKKARKKLLGTFKKDARRANKEFRKKLNQLV